MTASVGSPTHAAATAQARDAQAAQAQESSSSVLKTAITVAAVAAVAIALTAAFVFAAPAVGIITLAVALPLTAIFLAAMWVPRTSYVDLYDRDPVIIHRRPRPVFVPTVPSAVYPPVATRPIFADRRPFATDAGSLFSRTRPAAWHSRHAGIPTAHVGGVPHVAVGSRRF